MELEKPQKGIVYNPKDTLNFKYTIKVDSALMQYFLRAIFWWEFNKKSRDSKMYH